MKSIIPFAIIITTIHIIGYCEENDTNSKRLRVIISPDFPSIGTVKRGDVPNTMKSDHEDPTQASWGGQYKKDGDTNHFLMGPALQAFLSGGRTIKRNSRNAPIGVCGHKRQPVAKELFSSNCKADDGFTMLEKYL